MMHTVKRDPDWIEYIEARRTLDSVFERFASSPPTSSDLVFLDSCLALISPFDGRRAIRCARVNCGSSIRDVRAADLDGDGQIEILAITDHQHVFALKPSDALGQDWQITLAVFPELNKREAVGISLYEDEVGQTHASVLSHDGEHTFINAVHLSREPFDLSIRHEPRMTPGATTSAPRREGSPPIRSLDVIRSLNAEGAITYEIRAHARGKFSAHDISFLSRYRILAVAYNEHGIVVSDTSPALRMLRYRQPVEARLFEDPQWSPRLNAEVTSLCLASEEELFAATIAFGIYCLDPMTGQIKWNESTIQDITALDVCNLFGNSGRFVIAATSNGWLDIYEVISEHEIARACDVLFEWIRLASGENELARLSHDLQSNLFIALAAFRRALGSNSPDAFKLVQSHLAQVAGQEDITVLMAYLATIERAVHESPSEQSLRMLRDLQTAAHAQTPLASRQRIACTATRVHSLGYEALKPLTAMGEVAAPSLPRITGEMLASYCRQLHIRAASPGIVDLVAISNFRDGVPPVIYSTLDGEVFWIDPQTETHQRLIEPTSVRRSASVVSFENALLCVIADANGRVEVADLNPDGAMNVVLSIEDLQCEVHSIQAWSEHGSLTISVCGENWCKLLRGAWRQGGLELQPLAEASIAGSVRQDAVKVSGTLESRQWFVCNAVPCELVVIDALTNEERQVLPFASTPRAFALLENDSAAIACSDGFLYLVTLNGELRWRMPTYSGVSVVYAFDVNGDGHAEIVLGMRNGELIAISATGETLWRRSGESRPVAICGMIWADGRRRGLVVAYNDRLIEWLELLLPDQTWREMAETAGRPNLHDALESRDPYLRVLAFHLLAGSHDSDHIALVRNYTPEPNAPQVVQLAYTEAIIRGGAELEESLWNLLAAPFAADAKCLALRSLPATLTPTEIQHKVLLQLAVDADRMVCHAIVHWTRRVLAELPGPIPGWAFDLLHAASWVTGDQDEWIAGEVAVLVGDVFKKSPAVGWHFAQDLMERGVNPRVLQMFSSQVPPVMKDVTACNLLAHVGALAAEAAKRDKPRDKAHLLSTLHALAGAIEDAQATRQIPKDGPESRVYTSLAALARVEKLDDLKTLFMMDATIAEVAAWLRNDYSPLLRSGLNDLLGAVHSVLTHGFRRLSAYDADELQSLQQLANELEAWRAPIERSLSASESTIWAELMTTIVGNWLTENGALGKAIYELEHNFSWNLMYVGFPRLIEDEVQVALRITNTSRVTAYHLMPGPVVLLVGNQELIAGLDLPASKAHSQLNAGDNFTFQINAQLPKSLIAHKQEIEVRLTLSYFVPPQSDKSTQSVRVPFGGGVGFEIKYPEGFPNAWARYGLEARRALRAHQHLLMVELDRSARQSFLQELMVLVQDLQPVLIDLREAYRRAMGKLLQVRAKDLHLALGQIIWQNNPAILDEIEQDYRDAFQQYWRATASAPGVLFLDHFDYLVDRLLESTGGREVLTETLDLWLALVKGKGSRIVLGGSYLTRKVLAELVPKFHSEISILPANEIAINDRERHDLHVLLQRASLTQRVSETVNWFLKPLTVTELIHLCGGNLHLLRVFGLDALTQAEQDAKTPTGKKRLGAMEVVDYLLEFGNKHNFHSSLWVWLSFYEKLVLILVAQSEFALERADWVSAAIGLRLSRDYYPGAPGGHRSRKLVAERDTVIDEELAQKIRSDKYFRSEGVWVQGISLQRPSSFEQEPAARMLWHMLEAVGREAILRQLADEGILQSSRRGGGIGEVFDFRTPLTRLWFRKNNAFERLKAVAQGSGGSWAPRELWLDQRAERLKAFLYPDRPFEELVSSQIRIDDLPKIGHALHEEDQSYFFNFYGIGKRTLEPHKRWRYLTEATRALIAYRDKEFPPLQTTTTLIFDGFKNLLNIVPADVPPEIGTKGAGFHPIGEQGLIWQYSDFEQVFRGFHKEMLVGVIHDGEQFGGVSIRVLKRDAYEFVMRCAEAEMDSERAANYQLNHDVHLVVIFLVLRHHEEFADRWRRDRTPTDLRFVLLDSKMWAEVGAASEPRKKLMKLARDQVGWQAFSPYQFKGSLNPGSSLFVGRKNEIARILEGVKRQNFVILGSRSVGKTSLLHQLEDRLVKDKSLCVLPINLVSNTQQFFDRLRDHLPLNYGRFFAEADDPFEATRRAFEALVQNEKQLPVLLLDEVDGLYEQDRTQNHERFFLFLRDLTQSAPRLCSIIMTGYQRIFFALRSPSAAALYNFCEPINIAEIELESAKELIDILTSELEIEFYSGQGATELLLERTYCVPYLLQRVCHGLLGRLDSHQRAEARLEKEDIDAVLTAEIDLTLYDELFRHIGEDDQDEHDMDDLPQQRLKIMLLCIVIGKYASVGDQLGEFRRLKREEHTFTAAQVVEYMNTWASELKLVWPWNRDSIDDALRELTLTLTIGTEIQGDQASYYFPLDIVPTVLNRTYKNWKSLSKKPDDILDDLDDRIKDYLRLADSNWRS